MGTPARLNGTRGSNAPMATARHGARLTVKRQEEAYTLVLVRKDGVRQELKAYPSETIGTMLHRELAAGFGASSVQTLCATLEVVFCDVVMRHSETVMQVGMRPQAEISINGLEEAEEMSRKIEMQKAEESRKRLQQAEQRRLQEEQEQRQRIYEHAQEMRRQREEKENIKRREEERERRRTIEREEKRKRREAEQAELERERKNREFKIGLKNSFDGDIEFMYEMYKF